MNNQFWGVVGLGLGVLLASVAFTGKTGPASRVVVGLAAVTTVREALARLGAAEF